MRRAAINIPVHPRFTLPEDDTISRLISHPHAPARTIDRFQKSAKRRLARTILVCIIAVALMAVPALAGADINTTPQKNVTSPYIVKIGAWVMDFNSFSVEAGSVQTNFYLSLRSDTQVSLNDLEIVNGHITSVDTLTDTPHEKNYRIFATLDANPNLRLYPFDRHVLPVEIEPKTMNTGNLVFVIDGNSTGLDSGADLPGWEYGAVGSRIENHSYGPGETPFSRAVFEVPIQRDTASTILKFFLPIMLIIIVSLSSLLMKVSSRLGLNASMFLAAVLIHWRVADAIPLVAYATFLDLFMIITYATLVMVLVSGILIMKYNEARDSVNVDRIHRWSVRYIPPLSIALYILLFIAFLR